MAITNNFSSLIVNGNLTCNNLTVKGTIDLPTKSSYTYLHEVTLTATKNLGSKLVCTLYIKFNNNINTAYTATTISNLVAAIASVAGGRQFPVSGTYVDRTSSSSIDSASKYRIVLSTWSASNTTVSCEQMNTGQATVHNAFTIYPIASYTYTVKDTVTKL